MTTDRKSRIDTGCKWILGMLRDNKDSGQLWNAGVKRLRTLLEEEENGRPEEKDNFVQMKALVDEIGT